MKRILTILLAALLSLSLLSLTACGGQETNQDADPAPSNTEPQNTGEDTPNEEANPNEVASIDYETDLGKLVYTDYEYANWALVKDNQGLTQDDKVLILKFDFTNKQTKPKQVQSAFYIQAFQNGKEIQDSLAFSSDGGAQYGLVEDFFSDVLKDSTISFGKLVPLTDDSPVTIMVSATGGEEDDYQMMTLDLGQTTTDLTEEDKPQIEKLLQGSWTHSSDSVTFVFKQGKITMLAGGTMTLGTYQINADNQEITSTFQASNGKVTIKMPFQLKDDSLQVFNNTGEALIKEET